MSEGSSLSPCGPASEKNLFPAAFEPCDLVSLARNVVSGIAYGVAYGNRFGNLVRIFHAQARAPLRVVAEQFGEPDPARAEAVALRGEHDVGAADADVDRRSPDAALVHQQQDHG